MKVDEKSNRRGKVQAKIEIRGNAKSGGGEGL